MPESMPEQESAGFVFIDASVRKIFFSNGGYFHSWCAVDIRWLRAINSAARGQRLTTSDR
jgi:hypothetical protein